MSTNYRFADILYPMMCPGVKVEEVEVLAYLRLLEQPSQSNSVLGIVVFISSLDINESSFYSSS
jgi:hypothetical protein